MNLSFATTGASYPWLHSKRCSVSEPGISPRHMSRYVALPTSLSEADPTYWGLLKQPDKQKLARPVAEINGQQVAVRRSDFNTGEGGFYLSSFTRRRSCGYIPVHIAFQVEGIADQHSRATMERTGVTRLNPLHISEAADQNGGEEVGGD